MKKFKFVLAATAVMFIFSISLNAQQLYVQNGSSGIGNATTPNVGVGVSNPNYQFEVFGNTLTNYPEFALVHRYFSSKTGLIEYDWRISNNNGSLNFSYGSSTLNYPTTLYTDYQFKHGELVLNNCFLNLNRSTGFLMKLNDVYVSAETSAIKWAMLSKDFLIHNGKLDVHSGDSVVIAEFNNNNAGANIEIRGGNVSAMIRNTKHGKDFEFGTFTDSGVFNDNQLYLNRDGFVGIGTSSPTTSLDIYNGVLKISGNNDLNQDDARFVIDQGTSTSRFIELRNSNGNQFVVEGNGKVYAKEIEVTLSIPLADYVFADDYKLMSIYELESFVKENSHLPGVPSAKEVAEDGINLGEMDNVLLEKIEELSLYIIQQQKEIDALKEQVKDMSQE